MLIELPIATIILAITVLVALGGTINQMFALGKELRAIEQRLNRQFDQINVRLDRIEARLTRVEAQMEVMQDHFGKVEARVLTLERHS